LEPLALRSILWQKKISMKTHPLLVAIALLILPVFITAQAQDSGAYKLTPTAKWADVGIMGSDRIHMGYLYQLDSANIDILKRYGKTNATPTYSKFQLPVNRLKFVKIYTGEADRETGAFWGAGIGFVGGVLVASVLRGPKCETGTWHPGQLADCFSAGLVKISKIYIVAGSTLTGTIMGALIGARPSITIPINGKRENYEAAKPKLLEFTILRN
jgi:hypothetical protein